MWALAHNLNPILIAKLRESFHLSDAKAMLVDSAFYIAYFFMALPSATLISRCGYQKTIMLGLLLFALGTLGFVLASAKHSYEFFLGALLLIGSGITILEAAANPLITRISDPTEQVFRLNLAQSFNGLGAIVAAGLGGYLLLSDSTQVSFSNTLPFLILAIILLALLVFIGQLKFPEVIIVQSSDSRLKLSIFRNKVFLFSVIAQFFYVGAQIGVSSFFIRYLSQYHSMGSLDSAYYLSLSLSLFTAGRFLGSWLMKRWPSETILLFFSFGAVLSAFCIVLAQPFSFYFLLLLPFFMSIMFPTIFALGIGALNSEKEQGGAIIVMTISGGALVPFCMAQFSQSCGELRWAYILPLFCFVLVGVFAFYYKKMKHD
jgi:FHS family L-fucose permease-like MFS transporter